MHHPDFIRATAGGDDDMNPLDLLEWERGRTTFVLYGAKWRNGKPATYFKQAFSLDQAIADLNANPAVEPAALRIVCDVIVEKDDEPILHVDLVSLTEAELLHA